jgi:pimeloyl-ACP methyl ester carboxylesterase
MIYLLHGGPGANGGLEFLAEEFGAEAPLQRRSGGEPLTVARHVADLHALVTEPPILVGHSWGAMLALCYAAEHPVERLLLVGCGTFDPASRAELVRRREASGFEPPDEEYDERGHEETWSDMLHRQADGTYPAVFARIDAPVTMLHGELDEHPGPMIRDHLRQYMPQLEYVEVPGARHEVDGLLLERLRELLAELSGADGARAG